MYEASVAPTAPCEVHVTHSASRIPMNQVSWVDFPYHLMFSDFVARRCSKQIVGLRLSSGTLTGHMLESRVLKSCALGKWSMKRNMRDERGFSCHMIASDERQLSQSQHTKISALFTLACSKRTWSHGHPASIMGPPGTTISVKMGYNV